MNRTILFLIAFVVLGIASFLVLSGDKEKTLTSLAGEDRQFAIEDIDRVHKIFLADRKGNQTTLERTEGYWIYNGKYKANPDAIKNLLDAIKRIQMLYKPADAAVPGMVKSLATEGIKVEVYDRQDDLLKAYYVGGATPDERGTYLIMEGAEQPYVGALAGWQGNVRFRYSLTGADWRDKTIFAAPWKEIEAVSILYPKQRDKSFKLSKENSGYGVVPYFEITPKYSKPPERANVERFLLGFKWIAAEAFENDNQKRDSVLQTVPFCVINFKKQGSEEKLVKLFPIYADYGGASGPVVERYFADVDEGEDFMLVQNRLFKEVFWAYEFFF